MPTPILRFIIRKSVMALETNCTVQCIIKKSPCQKMFNEAPRISRVDSFRLKHTFK